jgi:hypothetical protein
LKIENDHDLRAISQHGRKRENVGRKHFNMAVRVPEEKIPFFQNRLFRVKPGFEHSLD